MGTLGVGPFLFILLNLSALFTSLACPYCPYLRTTQPKDPHQLTLFTSLSCPYCPYRLTRKEPPRSTHPKPRVVKPPHIPKRPPKFPSPHRKWRPSPPPPTALHAPHPKIPKPPVVKPPWVKPPVVKPPQPPQCQPPPRVKPKPPPSPPETVVPSPPPKVEPPPFVPVPPTVTPPPPPTIVPTRPPVEPTPPTVPPPKPVPQTCPIDGLKLGACVDLLGGLVYVGIGPSARDTCCPILGGLLDLDAALCLCTTIKLKLLNINIILPIALQVLLDCGKTPPEGFMCPS